MFASLIVLKPIQGQYEYDFFFDCIETLKICTVKACYIYSLSTISADSTTTLFYDSFIFFISKLPN